MSKITKYIDDIEDLESIIKKNKIFTRIYIDLEDEEKYTSYKKPYIFHISDELYIYLNIEYYNENYEELNNILINLLSLIKYKEIEINENIVLTNRLIDIIISNDKLKTIFLKDRILDRKLYDLLEKNRKIELYSFDVCKDLYHILDGTIPHNLSRPLVDNLSFNDIIYLRELDIRRLYQGDDLNYLVNNLNSLLTVNIYDNGGEILEFSFSFLEKIKHLIENVYYIKIYINKNLDSIVPILEQYLDKFENIRTKLKISYNGSEVTLDEYLVFYKKIKLILRDIENLELSPLEKYIYAFNYVKCFRKYKSTNDIFEEEYQRVIFKLLDEGNDLIVCTGFSALLKMLCNALNIDNEVVYLTLYEINENNEMEHAGYHTRNIVRIIDDKYNINGLYISEIGWSNMYKKIILLSLMNIVDSKNGENLIKTCTYDILCATSYDEFLKLIEISINNNEYQNLEELFNVLINIFPEFSSICNKSDKYNSYIRGKKRYFSILKVYEDENILKGMYDIMEKYCHNYLDPKLVIEGAVNLYKKLHPQIKEDELQKYYNDLILYNSKVYDIFFPIVVGIDNNENYKVIANNQNPYILGPRKIKN